MSTPSPNVRLPALDGLRGLAILLVIPHNTSLLPDAALSGIERVYGLFCQVGWIGVQLFFVLSGFLITGGLLDSQGASNYFGSFYMRRALRILPLYLAVLCVSFLALVPLRLLPQATLLSAHHQIWLWTFLSNWTDPGGLSVNGFTHFWSLAVEEQFYLLWPVVVLSRTPGSLLRLSALICLTALLLRIIMRVYHESPEALYEFTVCRMDALAVGAMAAAAQRIPPLRARLGSQRNLIVWSALGLLVVTLLLTDHGLRTAWPTQTFGMTLFAAAFALIVLGLADPAARVPALSRMFGLSALRSVGKYSYAMYVLHFPLHKFVGERLLAPPAHASIWYAAGYSLAIAAASYAAAWCSYRLLERPFLELKRYFQPRPDSALRSLRGDGVG
ncbi:MAG TPA: acyltransferase [Steroidobacteraceae bacterium]|nr:acyltransferase [Steroidobacteraceae bacterium]